MSRIKRRILRKNGSEPVLVQDHTGLVLKAARLEAEQSLADIAADLRIQANYLSAIECFDQEALPSIGYVLGYVRAYARYLGLEPNHIVTNFKRDIARPQTKGAERPHYMPKKSMKVPRGTYAIGTLLGCALVVFSWYGMRQPDARSDVVPGPALSAPVPESVDIPVKPDVRVDTITLKAVGPSWVEIIDDNGDVIVSKIMVPGEIITTSKDKHPQISARDGGALELYIGGSRVGVLGELGESLSNFSLIPTGE